MEWVVVGAGSNAWSVMGVGGVLMGPKVSQCTEAREDVMGCLETLMYKVQT